MTSNLESLFSIRENRVAVGLVVGASIIAGLLDWFWCDWFYPGFLFGVIVGVSMSMIVILGKRR